MWYFVDMSRFRSLYLPGISGTVGNTTSTAAAAYSECTDTVGSYGVDHPFTLDRYEARWARPMNGTSANGTKYKNYPIGMVGDSHYFPHNSIASPPSDGALMAKLLSMTNPSRPVVDLPVGIAELREIPKLIKESGEWVTRLHNTWKRRRPVASLEQNSADYLAYTFGWRPLIRDLRNSLLFTTHFHKREVELRNIFEGGGISRRRQLWEADVTGPITRPVLISQVGNIIRVQYQIVTRRRVWGTVRWLPDPSKSPPVTDLEYLQLARKCVLGLHADPAALWQALPWSWLVDWFTSAGDYFEAQRNTVPAYATKGCIMQHTESYRLCTRPKGIDGIGYNLTDGEHLGYRTTKVRRVGVSPQLTISLPFLSARQVSILGALSVIKNKRRLLY